MAKAQTKTTEDVKTDEPKATKAKFTQAERFSLSRAEARKKNFAQARTAAQVNHDAAKKAE